MEKNSDINTDGNVVLGSLYICISATMFALAGAAVKLALRDIEPIQLVFWRNLLSMAIFFGWLFFMKREVFGDLKSNKFKLHFLRSTLSLFVLYCYFYAVSKIELATAVLLLSTSPVFVPIVALVWIGYRVAATVWAGILVAFLGIALVTDPSLQYNFSFSEIDGLVAGVMAGFLGGTATVAIWKMAKTESPARQIVYFTVISFVLSIPAVLWDWQWPKPATYVPIIFLGVATTLAQYYLSKGCSVAPADKINTWNYLSIVIAAIAAYIGWNEKLGPVMIFGMILVVTGAHLASTRIKQN